MSTQRFDPTETKSDPVSSTAQVSTPRSGWQAYLHEAAQRLRPSFGRRESWQRAVAYIEGLLSTTERKNAWQLAEVGGDATPYGIPRLLGRAAWQADDRRDALYAYVVAQLGGLRALYTCPHRGRRMLRAASGRALPQR